MTPLEFGFSLGGSSSSESKEAKKFDVGIIGTGPAGLQAAIYTTRRSLKTVIFGKVENSDLYISKLENLFGAKTWNGAELLLEGRQKIEGWGGVFTNTDIVKVRPIDEYTFELKDEKHNIYHVHTVLFATGIKHDRLGVPGEKEYLGKGVSTCVECDAHFFKGKTVAVVGAKSAAIEGVEILHPITNKVYLITQEKEVDFEELKYIKEYNNVEIINDKVKEILGDGKRVTGVILENGKKIDLDGVFIELGAKGIIELTTDILLELDEDMKHIVVNRKMETNVKGVYAAGDITGLPYQAAKAIGEGAVAGIEMGNYVIKVKRILKAKEGKK